MGIACSKLREEDEEQSQNQGDFAIQKSDIVQIKHGSIREQYTIGEKIEDDKFASIFRCKNKQTRMKYTAKMYNVTSVDQQVLENFIEEARVLQEADHPNIIKVIDIFQDRVSAVIVTEQCKGGELLERIQTEGNLSEKSIASYVKQIASALVYLHSKNVVHRDLRPEVCAFVSKDRDSSLKIVDFGSCKHFEKNIRILERVGSPYFMAPEVVIGNYDSKCDVWSLGVIFHVLLTGKPPFTGKSENEIINSVLSTVLSFDGKTWKNVSDGAKELLKKMLVKNPNERISARQVLKDEWVTAMSADDTPDRDLVSSTLQNLNQFAVESKLHKATLAFIVSQLIGSDDVALLQEVFKKIDKNGDGLLSRREIRRALEDHTKYSDEDIARIIERVDLDRNDKVNYSEFLTATIDWDKEINRERLEKVFKALDLDHSGKISKEELMAAFGGSHIGSKHFEEMISEADVNGDGEIDLEEFCNYMSKVKKNKIE